MQAIITYNEEEAVPVLTLSADTEAEEVSLQLLAAHDDINIVVELKESDELVFKHLKL
jgi:hypothetical protein